MSINISNIGGNVKVAGRNIITYHLQELCRRVINVAVTEGKRESQQILKTTLEHHVGLHRATKSQSQTKMLLNLVHRNKKANDIHEGKWNGLGGNLEAGETPEECVIREVYEESGLSIRDPKLCGLLIFPQFKGNDWYVFVYTAGDFTGELIDSPEGRLEWIPDEQVLNLNLWESDHIFMPWIQEGEFFSAKFEYDGDTMRGYEVVFHS